MARRNRVSPLGEIFATAARGTLMGNRGILHDAEGRLGPARWRHKAWISCRLAFKDRRRAILSPNHYTELFFLDEAVALAAGHRPCAECRRDAFEAYREAVAPAFEETPKAGDLDRRLHGERIERRTRSQRRHVADPAALPDGAFVLFDGLPQLLKNGRLHPWSPAGYGAARRAPSGGHVTILTPPLSLAALANGYRPEFHPTLSG